MYLSLSAIDVAIAHHEELVAVADRMVLIREFGVQNRAARHPLRRATGGMLVRLGQRMQGGQPAQSEAPLG